MLTRCLFLIPGELLIQDEFRPLVRRLGGRLFVQSEFLNPSAEFRRCGVVFEPYKLKDDDYQFVCQDLELLALVG